MRRSITLIWLTIVWVTLWEDVSWANVIGGVIVAIAVMLLVPFRDTSPGLGLRPLHAIRLLVYFIWELIKASIFLSWEVVTPPTWVNPGIVLVPLTSREPGIMVSVANMVSLVPGTLTMEVDEETLDAFVDVFAGPIEALRQTPRERRFPRAGRRGNDKNDSAPFCRLRSARLHSMFWDCSRIFSTRSLPSSTS